MSDALKEWANPPDAPAGRVDDPKMNTCPNCSEIEGIGQNTMQNLEIVRGQRDRLLESCKALLGCMSLAGWEGDPVANQARAALTKHRGQS